MAVSEDSVEAELRVGMLDMALAKLLSDQHHTIEFPTLLLPENVKPGSIVRLTCTRAAEAELEDAEQFDKVQAQILELFATHLPQKPMLRARNVTQTSVVLEWDPIDIASADLRYLALYKGPQRLGLIPNALKRTSMKVSNLEIDMPYQFQLVLSSSAGDFESDVLEVQTHKMSDLSGVVVCIGSLNHSNISAAEIEDTLQRLGCKPAQSDIKLDTTHFLCTTEGGSQYDRAVELSIPIVRPEWLKACEAERKLVSVRGYYLSADPQLVPPTRERAPASSQASVADQQSIRSPARSSSDRRHEEPSGAPEAAGAAESELPENEPAADELAEVEPADNKPAENEPTENGPAENGPAENGPAESGPAENEAEPHAHNKNQHVRFHVPEEDHASEVNGDVEDATSETGADAAAEGVNTAPEAEPNAAAEESVETYANGEREPVLGGEGNAEPEAAPETSVPGGAVEEAFSTTEQPLDSDELGTSPNDQTASESTSEQPDASGSADTEPSIEPSGTINDTTESEDAPEAATQPDAERNAERPESSDPAEESAEPVEPAEPAEPAEPSAGDPTNESETDGAEGDTKPSLEPSGGASNKAKKNKKKKSKK